MKTPEMPWTRLFSFPAGTSVRGRRLSQAIAGEMGELSVRAAKTLVDRGRVFVDNRRVLSASYRIQGGEMKWEEYLVPTSLEEALAMLKERQGQARVIAGGTDLVIQLKKKEVTAQKMLQKWKHVLLVSTPSFSIARKFTASNAISRHLLGRFVVCGNP